MDGNDSKQEKVKFSSADIGKKPKAEYFVRVEKNKKKEKSSKRFSL